MDSYTPLLEKTRVPQPSLQKYAVISIFEKLRSAPPHLNLDSAPGTDAITQCLHSASAAVVDQSVREVCRLVTESRLDISRGLLELQSALEGSHSHFVNVFVKGLGFLVRLGFQRDHASFRFSSSETHPFVKILSCRREVQSELVQQVLIFMVQSKHVQMEEVCDFLRPFLNYAIIQMPVSVSFSSFVRKLISSMASLCCSFPREAIPVIKLLMGCLKFFPCKNAEFTNICYSVECLIDAYVVVLRQLVEAKLMVHEVQLFGAELLETIFSRHKDFRKHSIGIENILEIAKNSLVVQKNLGLSCLPEISSITLSLFMILTQAELEHEQYSIAKFLLFLLKWKSEKELNVGREPRMLYEELLLIFPIINLQSSPSKYVKRAATDLLSVLGKLSVNLLVTPSKQLAAEEKFASISSPECIIFRFLKHLWFQDQASLSFTSYLNFASIGEGPDIDEHNIHKSWMSLLAEYSKRVVDTRKSSLPISQSQEMFLTEMPLILGAVTCVFLTNPTLGSSAVDLLAVCGTMDRKLGVSLLLVILFYNHIFSCKQNNADFHGMLLKLLGVLPSLASHPAMVPLIVQTISPMLQMDKNAVLYATGTRLICKAWENNDRVFGSLQGVLLPKGSTQFSSERDTSVSKALSILDVCRKNADRGVDLILAVAGCIENRDPLIQSAGLQSLAHLCEADVIDFYTAWDVIAKHVLNYSSDATIAYGLCLLLKWGAMDAEAYPEASANVVKILWEIGSSRNLDFAAWAKARASAFEALTHYEVIYIERSIPDFKDMNIRLLTSETEAEVLKALEGFEVKIINYEHNTRRRLVKQKRVPGNKIEKLLDVFPRSIFASGKNSRAGELPGAALFCLSLTSKDVNNEGSSKGLQNVHANFETGLLEIAASLPLSRNILIALLSLQSWKPFMRRWLKACTTFLDSNSDSNMLDKTSKAANDILKVMKRIAEDSIPSCAENIALAVGALCLVLPPSTHAVTSTASKFLLNWLFQYEHECRQWSAAISLGLVSSCLHLTDHKQKFENITSLLEVASVSKSTLVKGACAVGLGFSCQELLTWVETEDKTHFNKETYRIQEADLLRKIIKALSYMIGQYTRSSASILQRLCACFPSTEDGSHLDFTFELNNEEYNGLEGDVWGVAGLVLGLSSSVSAIYRGGGHDAVVHLKAFIISWIPHVNPSVESFSLSETLDIGLSVGSCLSLPIVVAFCQKVELIDDTELDSLMSGYMELISDLLTVKTSGTFHQSLLMASCMGAGSLLSCILNEGVHSLRMELVRDLLALLRRTYTNPNPALVHLGGMLGIVNALGAGAGTMVECDQLTSLKAPLDHKESSYVTGPLLLSPLLEHDLTSLIQEIFLIAQNSNDNQLQQHAAWAVSFLRHYMWSREHQNEHGAINKDPDGRKLVSQNFAEDRTVTKLSSWLMHLSHHVKGAIPHVETVASVLRCLSHAPRVPSLDWGATIRRCMRYEGQVAELSAQDLAPKRGFLREECVAFALSHANQHDELLNFLDELTDVSRFRTLELNLQSYILLHLADLTKIFSDSRLQKLFDDLVDFLSSSVSSELYTSEQKNSIRASCWKGLHLCLDGSSAETHAYMSNLENCLEVLFTILPEWLSANSVEAFRKYSIHEWSEAVRCLGKAQQGWLVNLLLTSEANFMDEGTRFSETVKKIQVKARLVCIGSLPLNELGKLRAYIFNNKAEVMWGVLVDMAAALQHAEGSIKRQWLLDTLEMSCVVSYPSTALQFVGLLCGSCCKYMPLLIVDRYTVLQDLPVTLGSLLQDTIWEGIAESAVSYLWTSTDRIYDWVTGTVRPNQQQIDASENDMLGYLLRVMHHTCVSLKDYLSPDKQLRLANMMFC